MRVKEEVRQPTYLTAYTKDGRMPSKTRTFYDTSPEELIALATEAAKEMASDAAPRRNRNRQVQTA